MTNIDYSLMGFAIWVIIVCILSVTCKKCGDKMFKDDETDGKEKV